MIWSHSSRVPLSVSVNWFCSEEAHYVISAAKRRCCLVAGMGNSCQQGALDADVARIRRSIEQPLEAAIGLEVQREDGGDDVC